MGSNVVVAMDGPSGSGKSSTSKGVAARLGLRYLDTGSMFRAMTWWMLQHGVDVNDPAAVAACAHEPVLGPGTEPLSPTITVDGTDVAVLIRSQEVTAAVSAVSAVPEVRARLLELERSIIGAGGIVVEGRDIGTVVVPDAPVKVYLTADSGARAVRRTAEMQGTQVEGTLVKGSTGEGTPVEGSTTEATSVEATQQDLIRRDKADSGRTAAPLTMAADAHHIDTTPYTLDEVIAQVLELVEQADTAGGPSGA